MLGVVDRWGGAVVVHLVTLVVLFIEGEVVLGFELCSLIAWEQELEDISSAKSFEEHDRTLW